MPANFMPANTLNLPCYKVIGIQENEHDYHIDVETIDPPTSCPHWPPTQDLNDVEQRPVFLQQTNVMVEESALSNPHRLCCSVLTEQHRFSLNATSRGW